MSGDVPYDALTTLIAFMVGVPAVVLQTLPPEVRRVVSKRWGRLLADLIFPVFFAIVISLAGIFAPRLSPGITRITWTGILGILVLTTVYTVFRILSRYGRRMAIVRALEREVGRRIRKSGRLREQSLDDLVDLGRQSQPGREKELVLDSLQGLSVRVYRHAKYAGDGFEDLVFGVMDIVLGSPLQGNGQNFASATRILQGIVLRYESVESAPVESAEVIPSAGARSARARGAGSENSARLKHADLIVAIRALSKLGKVACRLDQEAIPLAVVQAVSTSRVERAAIFVSQALFEVGVAAIETDQMLVAMSAIEKLLNLVEIQKPARGELVADTLGLLAHFHASGDTGRAFARVRLARLEVCLSDALIDALDAAAVHCAQTTHFRTADRIRQLAESLRA